MFSVKLPGHAVHAHTYARTSLTALWTSDAFNLVNTGSRHSKCQAHRGRRDCCRYVLEGDVKILCSFEDTEAEFETQFPL